MNTLLKSVSPSRFAKATGYAVEGVLYAFRKEPSFLRIAFIGFAIAGLGWYLGPLPRHEIAILVIAVAGILIAELLNTGVEIIAEFVHPERHERMKRVKDCAAGATFVATCAACTVCIVLFSGRW